MANKNDDDSGESFKVSDTLKKLLAAGVGAAFMTEESIRGFVGEMKLPKETLNLLLTGAAKSKEALTNKVGEEISSIIRKIDFVQEVSRFVEEHKFKINAEIEVIKRDKSDSQASGSKLSVDTEKKS